MAEETGKKATQRKQTRKEARTSAKKSGEKEKNPIVQEVRAKYTEQLRHQGVPDAQLREKLRTHLKDVVKPAMNEAKEGAKAKQLKGADRKKFVQEQVRSKLGLKA